MYTSYKMKSLIILGRQPEIGLAELESLYGAKNISSLGSNAIVNLPVDKINFSRLGGTIKLAQILDITKGDNLKSKIIDLVKKLDLPASGRITFGLSAYDSYISANSLCKLGLGVKKALKSSGHNVRIVPNREQSLSSAQVFHNKLTSDKGIEIIIAGYKNKVILARTTAVQDINAYTARDQKRPKRDARVGMLPPKLAQIIINLASADIQAKNSRLLDPFCGTGVILQEASIMGFKAYGTDINTRMVDYSKTNLNWLADNFHINKNVQIEVGDATTHNWAPPINLVATELDLGVPLHKTPSGTDLTNIVNQLNILHKKFIRNLHKQLKPGTRLCLAMPAWHIKGKFVHLPLLDQIEDLGYNRVVFEQSTSKDLIYHRSGQIVARELVILIRK
jgi:tRNA G10  N-methylase Trm11